MRPRSMILACLGFCIALPPAARADVTTFAQAGGWTAFGGTASDGKQVCGIAARDPAGREALMLKWFRGDAFLTLQAMRTSWAMAHHSDVSISLQIDRYPVWSATASGSGQAIEWVLASANIGEFESEFRRGSSLTLHLAGNGGSALQTSLAGSQAIVHSMVACMKMLNGSQATLPSGEHAPRSGPAAMPRSQRQV